MPDTALLKQHVHRRYPVVDYGRGVYLYDTAGKRYLDGSGGPMTASIGHGVEEIATAISAQLDRVAFTYRTQFTNEPAERLAKELTARAPGDLDWAFFLGSGSEATEFAMRAAIAYWREVGRPEKVKILGRHISYHGMTLGSLSMSGHAGRRPDYGTLLHAFPVGPPAYPYRYARPTESADAYAERSVAEFEAAVAAEGLATVAAVIVEPIVGAAGGVLVPPDGYMRRLREMCDRLGVLLILDEVITGMGRTGDWFACTGDEVVPDLLAAGKGLSAGYSPVGAVLMRRHVVEAVAAGSGVAPFGHTFSGNPLGAATCLAVLDYIEKNDVLSNARARGAQLRDGLLALQERFPFIADVRGRGLLWGFEFVTDADTRQPPDGQHNASADFADTCFDLGLIVYPAGIAPLNNAVILSPPLTISAEETELLLVLLSQALEQTSRAPWLALPPAD